MSKKRPTESSWDSDEELLNDTSGSAVTAFPKASELDLLGDDGELDEDALLGVDETGTKTTTISFNNDSLWPLTTRQRSKTSISHQEQVAASSEQAFVFEETDTADLEDELNVGGQEEDGSSYHVEGDDGYGTGLYHQGDDSSSADVIGSGGDRHVNFSVHGMNTSDSREIGYIADQTSYTDENGAEFGDVSASGDYIGEAAHQSHEDASGVELEYEQPVEHDEQVHLEYDDSHNIDHDGHMESEEPKQNYESESDSDNENSRHNRGKFTSERTGVISLTTPTNAREAIPDTLEINEEQAAQIEQFMSDKTQQKGKHKGRNQGRGNAHSRLGNKPNNRPQQNTKMPNRPQQSPKMPQGLRMGQFPRSMANQNAQMAFPFPGGPSNRGPFPGGLLNPRGPFPMRLLNQQGPFPGPQNNREPFPSRSGNQRASFGAGPMNMLMGGPQRGPFPHSQNRFPGPQNQRGPPNQRGPYPGNSQPQNLLNPQQRSQQMRGPPPNQLRPQSSFNQRMPNNAQLRQPPPQMRQQGGRMTGPGMAGPRPFMGQAEAGMRFVRAVRPSAANQQGQPIPPLLRPGMNLEKPPQGNQQVRPAQMNPLRPRFMVRTPPSGAPMMNVPVFQDNHQQSPMGGQGDVQTLRSHKIYINPRFQGQQTPAGDPNQGRTVKMGAPIQQKAKVLLDRAIQIQNKQAQPGQAAQAGMKRKSTGEEAVPIKVIKPNVSTPGKSDVTPTRVVQTGSEPVKEDPQKIQTLLDEQKRQREMIQRRKELARQKQAALKRMELEKRLKEEGKTLEDIMGTSKAEGTAEQQQTQQTVPPAKQISGSVAARLGPPPSQQQIRGPPPQQQGPLARPAMTRIRTPLPQNASSAFQRSPQFSVPQQSQILQVRAPGQTSAFPNRPPLQQDPRMRGPPPSNDSRHRGPPPDNFRFTEPPPSTNKPRFPPPAVNQFQTPPPNFDTRFQAPPPSQDHSFRVPPPTAPQRLRAPPPVAQPKLRTVSHQTTLQPSTAASHTVRYTTPPPAPTQTVRFQVSLSTPPPPVPTQPHTPQQYSTHYTPASAPVSQPPSHYSQPTQAEQAMYTTPVPQYPPPSASYQHSTYSHTAEHQYEPSTHQPPPAASSQTYYQPATSQYHQDTQHFQASGTPQYQVPPAQTQYQAPPAQTHYQVPPPQTRYQPPPTQPAPTQPPSTQPQYQATQYQATQYQASQYQTTQQYQTPPSQHYQSPALTYSTPDPNYDQTGVDYYSEPQHIQTVTSQVTATPSPVGDQRTVQHQIPVGQRIQTIGQRVQPVSGTQIRSIIHNVAAQHSQATKDPSAHLIQSQAAVSKVATDRQVQVLDGPQKILIQNVPAMATKETLIKICRHFGTVLGVNLMSEQQKAVIQFQKGEQAAKCVAKCNQRCLHKTRLTVKLLPG
ncbi:unnamed protein product [Candidula unifasciata]|uniref:RRM domain-containing protein n=1 Tax=Candidula unifasciata TaxID=100452 RepID=A0A8S3ZNZ7_9EUPU|nr:unnamed protein product [Candidula unifasciata]